MVRHVGGIPAPLVPSDRKPVHRTFQLARSQGIDVGVPYEGATKEKIVAAGTPHED